MQKKNIFFKNVLVRTQKGKVPKISFGIPKYGIRNSIQNLKPENQSNPETEINYKM